MTSDFSGEYVLNPQASILSSAVAQGIRSGRVQIEHQEPRFRCQLAYVFADDKTFDAAFELMTDGREVTGVEHGRITITRMYWDGDALVFTTGSAGAMMMTFRYELVDAGRRLRMVEELRGTDHDQDNLWIFDRQ